MIIQDRSRPIPNLAWKQIMPKPSAPPVVLTPELRHKLQVITRAASTPQSLAFRSRLILRLAESDEPPNRDVATEFECSRKG